MEITQELLDKYYLGQCSPTEKEAVERWLADEDETGAPVPPHPDTQYLEDRGWASFEARHPEVRHTAQGHTWSIRRLIAVAACLLLAGTLFFYLYPHLRQEPHMTNYHSYSVAPGKKATLTLADGTRIYLNSGSTVRYPERFDDSIRLITFSGEAFFEVAKNAAQPFVIETQQSVTRVLGTAFNLREYEGDRTTTVVVAEGRVSFSAKQDRNQQLMLTANELGRLKDGNVLKQQAVAAEYHTAWKENKLVFDDMPLEDIARTLTRWYGVEVTIVSHALAQQRYTGEFDHPSLQSVLKSLAFAIRFEYQTDGRHVTITPSTTLTP
ncbi:FecR family protein [Parapedobacter koreensis]|uniref:FecR family protein n=1 Tax=Parapedobacter koreensis TaxID=332977 RepID=A0A1H7JWA0_9SPHI|nr:FecR domain-containing protein [Parapedobacter koreensis]SEK78888.1 FecR family protein [Parapedobacter koreensis]